MVDTPLRRLPCATQIEGAAHDVSTVDASARRPIKRICLRIFSRAAPYTCVSCSRAASFCRAVSGASRASALISSWLGASCATRDCATLPLTPVGGSHFAPIAPAQRLAAVSSRVFRSAHSRRYQFGDNRHDDRRCGDRSSRSPLGSKHRRTRYRSGRKDRYRPRRAHPRPGGIRTRWMTARFHEVITYFIPPRPALLGRTG